MSLSLKSAILSAAVLSATMLTVMAPASASPSVCPSNFFGGQAPDLVGPSAAGMSRGTTPLCFSEYSVLHSAQTRTPLWSADHLTAQRVELASRQRRADAEDTFHEQDNIAPADRAWLKDYARSGYDRGHMSPNGDMDNAVAQGESFTLANMVPQNPDNNRNLWNFTLPTYS